MGADHALRVFPTIPIRKGHVYVISQFTKMSAKGSEQLLLE